MTNFFLLVLEATFCKTYPQKSDTDKDTDKEN